jgi:hypothetical protein
MDQNLNVIDLRDKLIAALTYKMFDNCSSLMRCKEEQDYSHTNIYHYMVSFVCSYIDRAGDQSVNDIIKQPPTDLEITT